MDYLDPYLVETNNPFLFPLIALSFTRACTAFIFFLCKEINCSCINQNKYDSVDHVFVFFVLFIYYCLIKIEPVTKPDCVLYSRK